MSLPGDPALPGIAHPASEAQRILAQAIAAKGSDYRPRTRHLRPDGSPKYTNRLILESSPYLLQHAHNPVNWYPWGDEAFERARRENKPVLLSVGYSTCHWCHVMEEESFEDEEIAAYLNEHFIAIKVDREERPDIDDVYMKAVQLLTGRGGWPMTVALTPDRKPFFGGTYFPPRDGARGARKGFLTILRELAAVYANDPERVTASAEELSRRIAESARAVRPGEIPGGEAIYLASSRFARAFDREWGGFGGAPKFPRPVEYELLLRYYRRTNDPQALRIVTLSLEKMAAGGIYDHVGGGFHRYATDRRWLVPHFEKMLYDNAQLAALYLEAYQVTGNDDFARVARETLDYLLRDMRSPEGAFYSATDADSLTPAGHREEGYYFTWTPSEIRSVLDDELAEIVIAYYGVTEGGNFEGRNILYLPAAHAAAAERLNIAPAELRKRIDSARELLRRARAKRPAPLRDEKILTAWNGLTISALARAGFVFDSPDYRDAARRAADFVLARLRADDGRLLRSYKDGEVRHAGYLDDYAFFVQALLDLYEATAEPRWLREAIALQKRLDEDFFDDEAGGYFMTAHDHEALLARDKPSYDGAEPSGNSVAAINLLRLEEFTTEEAYRKRAEVVLEAFAGMLKSGNTGLPNMLAALDFYLDEPLEVLLVGTGRDEDAEFDRLVSTARRVFLPNRVLVIATDAEAAAANAALVPLLAEKRPLDGRATAYVCKKGYCERPTSDPRVFERQLRTVEPLVDGDALPRLPG